MASENENKQVIANAKRLINSLKKAGYNLESKDDDGEILYPVYLNVRVFDFLSTTTLIVDSGAANDWDVKADYTE